MNRKIYSLLALVLVLLAFGLLTSCSSSSSKPAPVIAITAASGTPQNGTINAAFPSPLVANVTSNGAAASGVTVTFSAPSSGASCALSSTTATTDASGNASVTCTANSTTGAYTVTATTAGASGSASFSLTNVTPTVFTFSVNGLEAPNAFNGGVVNYYGIAGAVAFDASGNVLGGEQDYNDGFGITSPSGGDMILASGSSLTVDMTTGLGTLILATNNTSVGVGGVETFAVQFANPSHALITQFDLSATSSGSMDVQSPTTEVNFAFTLSGVDYLYNPAAYGGVFSISSGTISGTADVNDAGTVTMGPAGNLTGAITAADAFGRGTATFTVNGTTLSLAYYNVNAEAVRIIDVDPGNVAGMGSAAAGSAYGQGASAGTFDSTSLATAAASSAFGLGTDSWAAVNYAAAGTITPVGTAGVAAGTFTGEGDDDELDFVNPGLVVAASPILGTYTIGSDGYGSLSITNGGLQDSAQFGLYMTDPALNLSDPNNTTGGGGALLLDLDVSEAATGKPLAGGTGIVVPQTDLAATSFTGSYAFGAQDYNYFSVTGWEIDYLGQGAVSSLALSGTGDLNDPFGGVTGTPATYTGVGFAGTAAADASEPTTGRYTVVPFSITPAAGITGNFTVAVYQASGGLLFFIDEDTNNVSLGTFQMQSAAALRAMHVRRGAVPRPRTAPRR